MRSRSLPARAAIYLTATVAVLLLWSAASVFLASPALPLPTQAAGQLVENLPELVPAFGVSLYRVVAALAIASALAIPAGLALGRSPRADALIGPVIHILYPVPKVVLLPVLLVFLGLGDAAKIALMAITVFFQVLVTVRDAAATVPATSLEAARSVGAGRWVTCLHVVVPEVLPALFTALRTGMGTCVAILFLAEAIAGSTGLGYFIVDAWGMLDYPRMFAGIIAMAVLGVGLYEALTALEWVLTPWCHRGRVA